MSTLPIKIPVYCSWNSATSLHHSPCQSRLLINHHICPSEMKPIISFHTHSHHFLAHPVNILSYTPLFRAEVSLWRAPGGSIRVEAPPIWLSPTSASFAARPSSATGTAQCSGNCLLSFQWGLVDLTQQIPPYSPEEITVECEGPSNTHLITSDVKSRFLCREAWGSINRFHLFPKKLLSTAMSHALCLSHGIKKTNKTQCLCSQSLGAQWERQTRRKQFTELHAESASSCADEWMVHARFSPVAVTSIYPMHNGQLLYARQFVKL